MLELAKRRRNKRHKQTIKDLRSIEDAILRRVLFVIEQEQNRESPERLARSVVNLLLGKPADCNGDPYAVIKQLAGDFVKRDEEVRDAVFISLLTLLSVEGENRNFEAERRILETIQWLKQFGEIPSTKHDPEILRDLAEKLRKKS